MEPFFYLEANGKNITDKINEYLIELEITDEAEDKSDSINLTLDDRPRGQDDATLEVPLIGTVIDVTIGYVGGQQRKVGKYLIDEIAVNNTPRSLNVTGRAAGMNTEYRTPKSQSYHQQTLGSIMSELAKRNGFETKIDKALGAIMITHSDQTNESDMAYAARLADSYDATAKPMDNKLVIARRGAGKSISGVTLPPTIISEADCSKWQFKLSARDEAGKGTGIDATGNQNQQAAAEARAPEKAMHDKGVIHNPKTALQNTKNKENSASFNDDKQASEGGVRAHWCDIKSGEHKSVTVGNAPFEDMRYTYHNESEAQAAIATRFNKSGRGKASLSVSMPGSALAQAEARLVLKPVFRAYIPENWRIKTVKHKISRSGGFTTDITADLFTDQNMTNTKPSEEDRANDTSSTDETGIIHIPKYK